MDLSPSTVIKGFQNPKEILYHLIKVVNTKRATKVVYRDWDNLIILDACRFDLFKTVNNIQGDLTAIRSLGSKTGEFLKANFSGDIFSDTVYISANPQVQLHAIEENFHDCVRLWETDWDDELNTVPPKRVFDMALEINDKYPNKRLIVHFIQPHYPFIGETGRQIDHGEMIGAGLIKDERSYRSIWEQLRDGLVDEELVWEAYRENLELTLPHVETLVSELPGKSVVTSDHGNAFGEWSIYGHPADRHISPLVKVPWLEIPTATRKRITSSNVNKTVNQTKVTNETRERLEKLGYIDRRENS